MRIVKGFTRSYYESGKLQMEENYVNGKVEVTITVFNISNLHSINKLVFNLLNR